MPATYAGPAAPLRHSAKGEPAKVRPSLALRLRVRWNAPQLDAALAEGADPGASKALGLRAQQLADPGHRTKIARSIDHLLALSERAAVAQPSITHVPLRPDRVEGSRPQLMELADRLEAVDSPPLKGLAMANLLVEDGTGALYARGGLYAPEPSDPLRPAVEAVLAALCR
jgi:hypothetical protein